MNSRDNGFRLPSPYEMVAAQCRVLIALMLRDIRTRFFGSALGFLLVIGWPLSHIVILLLINVSLGRTTPYGDSSALWFATGIVPFMSFSYMSRFIMLGIVFNRPLMTFPVLKITDILFARAILEFMNACVVIMILITSFWGLGIDFIPIDLVDACCALLATMLLGLGVGVINATIASLAPIWVTGYSLFVIILWLTSGVLFVPDALPASIKDALAYNPILQGVEWLRSAYYEGYGSSILDKNYVIFFGAGSLFAGLVIERLLRGRILQ